MIDAPERLPPALLETEGTLVLFPVRHHSPAAARLLHALIERRRPAAVLIEGPSDFNPLLPELDLEHQLPIAIFSSATMEDGRRIRSFYPLCEYSPEWQALRAARECGAAVRFIDLPRPEMAVYEETVPENAWADGPLSSAEFHRSTCERLGVPDINALWDLIAEVEGELSLVEYLARTHTYCVALRASTTEHDPSNAPREAAMARGIIDSRGEFGDAATIIVVTGGYHSLGILRFLEEPSSLPPPPPPVSTLARFVSLTPYSYSRLDGLTGYNAGMPSPGFYDAAWHHAEDPIGPILRDAVVGLRARKVQLSTADLIAVETMARGLAQLRGHSRPWRRDLLDALRGALLKESVVGDTHPLLEVVLQLFRGKRQGRIAEGVRVPALVREIRATLAPFGFAQSPEVLSLKFDLATPEGRARGALLRRLQLLDLPGVQCRRAPNFIDRSNLRDLREEWTLQWSPMFDGACVEASAYGATIPEACTARLGEMAVALPQDPEAAARLMVTAAQAALVEQSAFLRRQVSERIAVAQNFHEVAGALEHLLFLHAYDDVLGASGIEGLGDLLGEAWRRALFLAESLGSDSSQETLLGFETLQNTLRHAAGVRDVDSTMASDVFGRIAADGAKAPAVRGAATGALWTMGEAAVPNVVDGARFFGAPETIGHWLHGLFITARETALRMPELLAVLDETVLDWDEQGFLRGIPSLRLAFTSFTPREKMDLASRLVGREAAETLLTERLKLPPETMLESRQMERDALATMARYGIRGGRA